ncbi:MAG TPA: tetratricopeptide repeat protein [Cyclobacteriaceae bacterium]
MTLVFTALINLLFSFCLLAQDKLLVDSLFLVLEKDLDNQLQKAMIFNDLAWEYRLSEPVKAINYAKAALDISITVGSTAEKATSHYRIACVENLNGNFRSAVDHLQQSLKIERAQGHTYGMSKCLAEMCVAFRSMGNYLKAEKAGLESLQLSKALGNPQHIAWSYQLMASVYKMKGDYKNLTEMLVNKMNIANQLKDTVMLANTSATLGNIYSDIGDLKTASKHFNKSLGIWLDKNNSLKIAHLWNSLGMIHLKQSQYKQADSLFKLSMQKFISIDRPLLTSTSLNNLGYSQYKRKRYQEALAYYKKCIPLYKKRGKKNSVINTYCNIGLAYKDLGETEAAILNYGHAIALQPENPDYKKDIYWALADLYLEKKEHALSKAYIKKYEAIRDNMKEIDKQKLAALNNYEQEQNRLAILEKDNQLKATTIQKNRVLIVSLIVGLFMLTIIFGYIIYAHLLKQKVQIAENDARMERQKVDELIKDHELKELHAMLEGQEQERKRIARELHDRVGSVLSMVKIHMKSNPQPAMVLPGGEIEEPDNVAEEMIDEACDEVRRIAHNMVSGSIQNFGLINALYNLKETINNTGQLAMKVVDFGFNGERLPEDIEINTYRIVQELVSNTLKHANANKMSIQALRIDDNLNLMIEDNGNGFNPDKLYEGMGLKNIFARVNHMHGEIDIDSGMGSGTTISIDVPIND